MLRERIAENIYVFTSRLYAQETAGAILTEEGVVLIDTLFFPEETKAIKSFLEDRLGLTIRYLINTHYHADHTQGTYLFPHAYVISHARCLELLDVSGRSGLAQTQAELPGFEEVEIVLPDMTFAGGHLDLHFGGQTFRLLHLPGHSPDTIGVLLPAERILFAADNMMPVPTLFDGDFADLQHSLQTIMELQPECIVQGHGEVLLRGEVQDALQSNLGYLQRIYQLVAEAIAKGKSPEYLNTITIEHCGKSHLPLNGLATDLHQANLLHLYHQLSNNQDG
jgi:glyoxylase-like metal-dependent hydrolase (beta-lactamase superfamily II)